MAARSPPSGASLARSLAVATICGLSILLGLYACVSVGGHPDPRFDLQDADYRYIDAAAGGKGQPRAVDITRINGGDWQVLCVIGSYNNALQILRDEAERRRIGLVSMAPVHMSAPDLVHLDDPHSAVAYVDASGRGKIVLFTDFRWLTHQHYHQCYGPETREVVMPPPEFISAPK